MRKSHVSSTMNVYGRGRAIFSEGCLLSNTYSRTTALGAIREVAKQLGMTSLSGVMMT